MPALPVSNSVQDTPAEIAAQQSNEELGPLPSVAQDDSLLGVPPTTSANIAPPEIPTTENDGANTPRVDVPGTAALTPSSESETTAIVEQPSTIPSTDSESGQLDWISGYIWIPIIVVPILAWLGWRWLIKQNSHTEKTEPEEQIRENNKPGEVIEVNSTDANLNSFEQSLDELDDVDLDDGDLGDAEEHSISSAVSPVDGTQTMENDLSENLETFHVADARMFDFTADLDDFDATLDSNEMLQFEGESIGDTGESTRWGSVPSETRLADQAENPPFDLEESFAAASASTSQLSTPATFQAEIRTPSPGQPEFTAGEASTENEFAFDDEEDELDDDSELDLEIQVLESDVAIEREAESDMELEAEIQASESNHDLFSAEDEAPALTNDDQNQTLSLYDDDSDAAYDFDVERIMELEDSDSSLEFDDLADADDGADQESADAIATEETFNLDRPSSIAAAVAESREFFDDDSIDDLDESTDVGLFDVNESISCESDSGLPNPPSPMDTLSDPELIPSPLDLDANDAQHDAPEDIALRHDSAQETHDKPAEQTKAPSAADTIRDDGPSLIEPEIEKERFSILQSKIDELECENELLNTSLLSARQEAERREQNATKLSGLSDQLAQSKIQNADLASQFESLKCQLEQAQAEDQSGQIEELKNRLDAALDENESLKTSVNSAAEAAKLAELQSEQVNRLQDQLENSEQRNSEMDTQLESLRSELKKTQAIKQRALDQSTQIEDLQARLDSLQNETASLNATVVANDKETERLQQLLLESDQLQAQLDNRSQQNLELESRLQSLNRELEKSQSFEQERNQLQIQLEVVVDEKESLARELELAKSELLKQPAATVDIADPALSDADQSKELAIADPEFYKRFELRLKKEYKKRRQAERELDQAEEQRNELANLLTQTRGELNQLQEKAEQNKTLLQRIEKLESQPRSQSLTNDDLRLINGIGPVIMERLHKIGITTFDQIASWNAEVVSEIESELNLNGRITRERWVDQATTLAAEQR